EEGVEALAAARPGCNVYRACPWRPLSEEVVVPGLVGAARAVVDLQGGAVERHAPANIQAAVHAVDDARQVEPLVHAREVRLRLAGVELDLLVIRRVAPDDVEAFAAELDLAQVREREALVAAAAAGVHLDARPGGCAPKGTSRQ